MNSLKTIWILFMIFQFLFGNVAIEIVKISGEVKVRLGIEETWRPAMVGMKLKETDTILCLEGEVVLKIDERTNFHLGNNSILDMGDLRQISKRQLFLVLMSRKIEKIEAGKENKKIRIGNVSVIHGESRNQMNTISENINHLKFNQEMNGAKALYTQDFFTNSILSFYKILNKYEENIHTAEIYYYLGKSFETIDEPGQAIDSYNQTIEIISKNGEEKETPVLNEIYESLNKLKKKYNH
jgi:tetratricopeptide (TPR) repeat protein